MRFLEAHLLHGSVIVAEGRFLPHDAPQSCAGVHFHPGSSGTVHGGYGGGDWSILTAGRWAELLRHRDGCAGGVFRHHRRHLLLPCSRGGNLFEWPCDCGLLRAS